MPEINFLAIFVAALVPNVLGVIYYGPLFGKPWLSSLNLVAEDMKGRNEPLIYGSALVLSFIIATFLKFTISLTHKDIGPDGELVFASFGTFPHGALHGAMIALTMVVPVIVSLGLFQKSKGSNILLNVVFWILCYTLMGGILDAWN